MTIDLSEQAIQLLTALFAPNSPLQLPVGTAETVIEIRRAVAGIVRQNGGPENAAS